jgi:NAD(P)-dependent dehydrogenase (short-subunit alcohol dehydrogenase family)
MKNCIVTVSVALLYALTISTALAEETTTGQKAVLVTGATSGIGLKVAQKLAGNGFYVYAGARKDEDMQRLDAMENITAVRIDVTKQEQIDAAVDFVERAPNQNSISPSTSMSTGRFGSTRRSCPC